MTASLLLAGLFIKTVTFAHVFATWDADWGAGRARAKGCTD
eukprot:COSAG02_NODE_28802_length_582_cov_0.850932_2_plen_40_part_01